MERSLGEDLYKHSILCQLGDMRGKQECQLVSVSARRCRKGQAKRPVLLAPQITGTCQQKVVDSNVERSHGPIRRVGGVASPVILENWGFWLDRLNRCMSLRSYMYVHIVYGHVGSRKFVWPWSWKEILMMVGWTGT